MSWINFALNVLTETARYEWSYEEGWGNWKTIESALACVAGGISCAQGTFFSAATRGILARGEAARVIDHPSRRSAAKTIQHSHANPASYAG